jgi:SOS-response transcriptional repressor LexA
MEENELYQRIKRRLDALGITERQASIKAVGNSQFIRNIRKGMSTSPRGANIAKLARVLNTTEAWLLGTSDEVEAPSEGKAEHGIRYGGIVEAGAFRPWDELNQDAELKHVPLAPDARFPIWAQSAFEVIGNSMDRAHVLPGMYLQTIDIHAWEKSHGDPRDGQLVIVARTRDGNPERELTVKRLRVYRDRLELVPESSDDRHKPLVFPNPPRPEGEIEVQIIAVVISSHWLYV